jgi:hypothetical protein
MHAVFCCSNCFLFLISSALAVGVCKTESAQSLQKDVAAQQQTERNANGTLVDNVVSMEETCIALQVRSYVSTGRAQLSVLLESC